MFYLLHRMVKWFFLLLALACVYWIYLQRAAFQPLWVWYDVYENGGIQKTGALPIVQGQGLAVLDGHTLQMKSGPKVFSVRLTGFDIPAIPLSPPEFLQEKRRLETLRAAVVGQPIRVEITYSNQNSLLGVVRVGTTNLNTYFVANGLSRFNREYVKSTPRELQYKFFAAARAQEDDRAARASRD